LIANKSWNNGRQEAKAKSVLIKNHDGSWRTEEFKHLGSQVKQLLADQLVSNEKTLEKLEEKKLQKSGEFRFKRFVNSVPFIQPGVSFRLNGNKLQLQKFPGVLRVFGGKQLVGLEIASAKLVRKPDGFYFFVSCFENVGVGEFAVQSPVVPLGLDFGVRSHFSFSDGRESSVVFRESDRLRRLKRKRKRQVKGSKGYHKTRAAERREYQKLNRSKDAAAQKIVHDLTSDFQVFTQDDPFNQWKVKRGRNLQHALLGRVKQGIKRDPNSVVLPWWAPTTQFCPNCGILTKHPPKEKVFTCSECNYTSPRDKHAANNMILLGKLWLALKLGQELASTPVEGLSDKAQVSAVALLVPKEAGNDMEKKPGPAAEAALVSTTP